MAPTTPLVQQATEVSATVTDVIFRIKTESTISQEDHQLHNAYIVFLTPEQAAEQITLHKVKPSAVFVDVTADIKDLRELKHLLSAHCIPFLLFSGKFDVHARCKAIELQVDDYLFGAINSNLLRRINVIRKLKIYKANRENMHFKQLAKSFPKIKLWRLKRTVDILVAGTAILLLLPFWVLIAILIKLESRGPILYISKRAGSGYQIFDFYKFRSMRAGADLELKKLAALNQYGTDESDSVFFKLKDDPRITRFGLFLRKTSLDEIPQLLNVLKGDMSLVGNRPLPLYEAEKLTKDQIAWRFLAPAGLTGLWQITKRGKDDMSPEERIQLDMEYAMNNSFLGDIKIILKTFPALLQKETV
jgi:lipopolysaccharide/colanic/teichoic acid biosynthesis glycosyltransferase